MKELIYSKEDLDLMLTLELEEERKEIERLNKENVELKDTKTKYFNENRLLEKYNVRLINIIKEAREYIKSIPDDEFVESEHFTELLEILDKVEENSK